ncbi:MAG: hypothetical protein AB7W16_05625 [Candidatus Obscuribacterales bacterium]
MLNKLANLVGSATRVSREKGPDAVYLDAQNALSDARHALIRLKAGSNAGAGTNAGAVSTRKAETSQASDPGFQERLFETAELAVLRLEDQLQELFSLKQIISGFRPVTKDLGLVLTSIKLDELEKFWREQANNLRLDASTTKRYMKILRDSLSESTLHAWRKDLERDREATHKERLSKVKAVSQELKSDIERMKASPESIPSLKRFESIANVLRSRREQDLQQKEIWARRAAMADQQNRETLKNQALAHEKKFGHLAEHLSAWIEAIDEFIEYLRSRA